MRARVESLPFSNPNIFTLDGIQRVKRVGRNGDFRMHIKHAKTIFVAN